MKRKVSVDDYVVIVFKYLSYLYLRLKKGEPIEAERLMFDGEKALVHIQPSYWEYILDAMTEEKYIRWPKDVRPEAGGPYTPEQLAQCQITPKGIDYLVNNPMLDAIKHVLGGFSFL